MMKKPTPGKAHIIWGVILFILPFFGDGGSWAWDEGAGRAYWQSDEPIRWIGVGLIVYGFVKMSQGGKD